MSEFGLLTRRNTGRPKTRPAPAATLRLDAKQGIQAAIKTYESLHAANDATYDFGESELNALGYQLLNSDHKMSDAIEVSN